MYLKLKDSFISKFSNIFLLFALFLINCKNNKTTIITFMSSIITILILLVGKAYSHYFIITTPVFIVLLSTFLNNIDKMQERNIIYITIVFLTIIQCTLPFLHILCYSLYKNDINLESIDLLIDKNIPESEKGYFLIYQCPISGVIYSRENMLPKCKYAFMQENLFKSNGKIINEMNSYLHNSNIKWIITSQPENENSKNEVTEYIIQNYTLVDKTYVNIVNVKEIVQVPVFLYEKKI